MAPKILLFITALCLAFNACNKQDKQNEYSEYDDYDYDGIEVIVVNKIPRGAYAGEKMPKEFPNAGWYDIGLSRSGKEPIEYIWRAGNAPHNYAVLDSVIGDRGTIYLEVWAKYSNKKLPRPNAEKPSIIGMLGEVYWKKRK
jgi:hypothetical protein